MTKTMGYLVSCEDRNLFLRDRSDVEWALADENYTVTELVAKKTDVELTPSADDRTERLEILEELYELEEEQIAQLKHNLEEFVELVESIVEISTPTDNIIENKAKLLLIAESCKKLLKPKE